jgi:hypothetical protein
LVHLEINADGNNLNVSVDVEYIKELDGYSVLQLNVGLRSHVQIYQRVEVF